MTPTNPKDYIDLGIFIGSTFLYPKRSIRLVMDNLMKNEEIVLLARCSGENTPGVIAVTNKRVIFGSKVLFSYKFLDFDLSKLTSVNYSYDNTNQLFLGSIY